MESQPPLEPDSPPCETVRRGVFIDADYPLPTDSGDEPLKSDNSWLLSYIDLMTLLLTVFVLLLAYAKTDMDKFRATSEAMSKQTGRNALFVSPTASKESMLSQHLQKSIAESGMLDNIDVLTQQGAIELRMKDKILFESGTAQLRRDGKALLAKLIPLLQKDPYRITVEGHTDNTPIATERYPSNWELSAARASQVVRFLITEGIDPQRTRAIGYADTKPVAQNTTPEGRSQNRRVSLIIELKH
jgi:chemotaxis protein MotB